MYQWTCAVQTHVVQVFLSHTKEFSGRTPAAGIALWLCVSNALVLLQGVVLLGPIAEPSLYAPHTTLSVPGTCWGKGCTAFSVTLHPAILPLKLKITCSV